MASYFLKGMRVVLGAPNGPPNCEIEPGSILAKGDNNRLRLVGSIHQFVKSEGTKQYLLEKEKDIKDVPSGEGISRLEVDSSLTASFWAYFLRTLGWRKTSSSYILECTDAKRRSLKECPEVLRRFSGDIDINNILMPKSYTIAVVTSVCKSPHIDVTVKTARSMGGGTGIIMPAELAGLPPISAGVEAESSLSTEGKCSWIAKQGETFPVAIQGIVLRFESSGKLKGKKHFGSDGPQDHEPTPGEPLEGGPVVGEEGDDDGELYDFLYGQGLPEWSTDDEQVLIQN